MGPRSSMYQLRKVHGANSVGQTRGLSRGHGYMARHDLQFLRGVVSVSLATVGI